MFFDGTDVEDGCLAVGRYKSVIVSAEHAQNKAGTGSFVKVEFEIVDESGFTVMNWYNIEHNNIKVQAFGKRQFKELVQAAMGVPTLSDPSDLVGKKVELMLNVEDSDFGKQNKVMSATEVDDSFGGLI
jgi:hypothetical protein